MFIGSNGGAAPAIGRRQFLGSAFAGLAAPQDARRPNVIFLLTDDQRWDSLGAAGNRLIRTPNLDRLSEEGVHFQNHFVTTSICMASRATIFSGLYAAASGIYDSSKPFTPAQIAHTYPELFRKAGYHTGFIGKYGVGRSEPQGLFDSWAGFAGQGRYFPEGEGEGKPHLTAIMGDQAQTFLRSRPAGRPFCLSISFKAAHVQDEDSRQFLPSPESADLYRGVRFPAPPRASADHIHQLPEEVQRSEGRRRWGIRFSTPALYQASVRNYYRLISEVDREVGKLRLTLRELGLEENTVIVFSSDNGFYRGEHGLAGKWLMHEESIRAPLLIFDPRLPSATRGKRIEEMSLNLDIAPTLLDAAGLEIPAAMQGRSVYDLIHRRGMPWRRDWYYEHHDVSGGWIPRSEGVRTERWKYTKYIDNPDGFEELYDLGKDPGETRNLARAGQQREVLDALRRRYKEWKAAQKDWRADHRWTDPPFPPGLR